MLFHRVRFASEAGLVDKEVTRLEQQAIGGHQIPGRKRHHIARHQVGDRVFLQLAVAQHPGTHRHRLTQPFDHLPGAHLLPDIEAHADQHDPDDDQAVAHTARHGRNGTGQQQCQHQGVAQVTQVLQDRRRRTVVPETVGPDSPEPLNGLQRGQSGIRTRRPQPLQAGRILPPVLAFGVHGRMLRRWRCSMLMHIKRRAIAPTPTIALS